MREVSATQLPIEIIVAPVGKSDSELKSGYKKKIDYHGAIGVPHESIGWAVFIFKEIFDHFKFGLRSIRRTKPVNRNGRFGFCKITCGFSEPQNTAI